MTSRKVYDETAGWDAENGFFRLPVFVVTHPAHEVVDNMCVARDNCTIRRLPYEGGGAAAGRRNADADVVD